MSSNKLREVLIGAVATLEEIRDAFKNGTGGPRMWEVNDVISEAKSALSEPLRNCEVGTAKEQTKRFYDEYYAENSKCTHRWSFGECAIHWAQMPYEEVK